MTPLFEQLAAHSSEYGCGGSNPDVRRTVTLEGREWAFWSDGWRGLFVPGHVDAPQIDRMVLDSVRWRSGYGYIDANDLVAFVDANMACAHCNGTRSIECRRCHGHGDRPCERCLGLGSVPCDCPHCRGCECPECDGSGRAECRCGDGTEACDCAIPLVQVGPAVLDLRLLQGGLLSLADGTVEASYGGELDAVLFRGANWIALVMPRRRLDGDAPRVLDLARAPRRAA